MSKKKGRKKEIFDPGKDTGIKRPVTARVAVGDVNDKFSEYPSNGLTPKGSPEFSGRRMRATSGHRWSSSRK